jgi:putative transposase
VAHRRHLGASEHTELRERLRTRLGRDPDPSAAIVDSQTLRTTGVGGKERGFDPAKQVEGRKRHLLVDTEGLVLKAKVHSARVPDADGIRLLCRIRRAAISSLALLTCGSTLDSREGGEVGPRKLWDRVWRWCASPGSLSLRR